jgi:hypothetical protein
MVSDRLDGEYLSLTDYTDESNYDESNAQSDSDTS